MNIEPVSSAMSYQAQNQVSKPLEKAVAAENDVPVIGMEKPVDATTVVIRDAEAADGQGSQEAGAKEQQAQQSQESIKKMVDQLNKKMSNSEAIFGIHEGTNRITIKIVDKETKEVLKEYPPEKTLDQQNAKIKKAVDDINKKSSNSEAIFGIHEATNRVTIKIVDKTTKDVIKEYPPEKTLDMIAKVWEMAGILVDEKR